MHARAWSCVGVPHNTNTAAQKENLSDELKQCIGMWSNTDHVHNSGHSLIFMVFLFIVEKIKRDNRRKTVKTKLWHERSYYTRHYKVEWVLENLIECMIQSF